MPGHQNPCAYRCGRLSARPGRRSGRESSPLPDGCQPSDYRSQRCRIGRSGYPHSRSIRKLYVDRSRRRHASRHWFGRNLDCCKGRRRLRSPAQLPPPSIQLAGMYPRFARHGRYTGAWLQRGCDKPLLFRRAPAPASLHRCNDFNGSLAHVTIPMNSHMTHTIRRSARRPSTEGYLLLNTPALRSHANLKIHSLSAKNVPNFEWVKATYCRSVVEMILTDSVVTLMVFFIAETAFTQKET